VPRASEKMIEGALWRFLCTPDSHSLPEQINTKQ